MRVGTAHCRLKFPGPGAFSTTFYRTVETSKRGRASERVERGRGLSSSIITDVNYVRTWIGTRGDYGAGWNGRVRGQRKPEPVDECARCRTLAKSAHARPVRVSWRTAYGHGSGIFASQILIPELI